jgi:exosortase A-associated hydrolase 1
MVARVTPCREEALSFPCGHDRLVGVLCRPGPGASGTGVVFVVGGPQVRHGAHRMFVQLARQLAQAGHASLRFDVRGMGDSTGDPRSFLQLDADIASAVQALRQAIRPERVVLWGLCDGATAAALYTLRSDLPQVQGLCLANPWVRSEAGLARARLQHHYAQRLRSPDFWRKLVRGGVGAAAVRELWQHWRRSRAATPGTAQAPYAPQDFPDRVMQALQRFGGHTLVLLAQDDLTAREFGLHCAAHRAWPETLRSGRCRVAPLEGADHTFSAAAHLNQAAVLTAHWLAQPTEPSPGSAPAGQTSAGGVRA